MSTTISSFAVNYHERGDSTSEDSSWESQTEPSPLPIMVRESKIRKRQKLFANKKKGRGGKGRGSTVNISQKEKRKSSEQDLDSEEVSEGTLEWRLRSQARKEVKRFKIRLATPKGNPDH